MPPIPCSTVPMPPCIRIAHGTNSAQAASMKSIWMTSVSMLALIPEIREYENAISARTIVVAVNPSPVTEARIFPPARSCTVVDRSVSAAS